MSIRCAARTCGRPPTTTLSTCCCGRCAASTARRSSRSTACRRSITGVDRNGGGILTGLLSGGHRASGPGPDSHLDLRHPHRAGGIGRPGADAAEGGRHSFLRAFLGQPGARSYQEAYAKQVWTAHHWQHWLARGRFPDHRWRSHLTRSALTLKGLIFAPTGAIAAAATTSLPETPGGERNWDYRFTWIRAATFALWGLYTLGFEWEANDYFAFLCDLVERDQGDLQIVYGVDGRRDLEEHVLEHLSGYQGARPVRIGNAAYQQNQHDVWGVVLDSVYLHTKSRDRLDERVWKLARQQVERALERWREPDQGIWEVRGEPKHFTSSKMMCWVAADRGARLATLREDRELARTWRKAADEIHADICANALDERGVFCQHYDTTALDASLLLPLLQFLPPQDQRIRATVLAIAEELTQDGLVLRYQVGQTDDGLSGEEGTFTICSFWLVSALAEIGEHQRARDVCEKILSYASPLLLYGEEIDPRSGRHLGNFPQAFTHLALINAVMHVIRKEQAAQRMALGRDIADGHR